MNHPLSPNKKNIILLTLAFISPIVLAWLLYLNMDTWMPQGKTNYGDLVHPARPLPMVSLQQLGGGTLTTEDIKLKWTLVYITSSRCGKPCQQTLYKIRQIHMATGEDIRRVQRLMVLTDTIATEELKGLVKNYKDMLVVNLPADTAGKFLATFKLDDGAALDQTPRLYIVDPIGNLMMKYEADVAPKGIIKDLERLLKLSQVG